jgi:catechol 2,3-dioxygenase-like lactoylglutathione lyase family enzyme
MALTELNHYLLVARDLEKTKDFYCDVLGFELADRPDFGFPGYWLQVNGKICVHLASREPNKIRDTFLLKIHGENDKGSGSVDHIAFLADDPQGVQSRIKKSGSKMHFRSFPESKLYQIFLKDPDDVTIELNFLGVEIKGDWAGEDSESALTLKKAGGAHSIEKV